MNTNLKKFICLLVSIVIVLGFSAILTQRRTDPLERTLSAMSLRDKAAQMMIASFRVWKEVPETEDMEQTGQEPPAVNITALNDAVRALVSRDHFGGMLLFSENFEDAEQTLRLVAELQSTNRSGGGLPQMFFIDQEGGNVNRISYATLGVGNMALAATGDPANARSMAAVHGEELRLLGIQADFAPVADTNNNPANPVIGVRSFSDDPQTVAQYACAYMEGLHDAGIAAALKHFPGHGNTGTDSHTSFPVINSSYEELKNCELIPFKAAIDAGADLVMTAHIQYPQIETGTYTSISTGEKVFLPATMSHTILTDILRGDLGFEGVIVSDALDMASIAEHFSIEDTLKLAVNAGVNMLILPSVKDTRLFHINERCVDILVALVESGEVEEARLDESVLRILKLKQKYGVLDLKDFSITAEKIAAAKDGVGSKAHRDTEWRIAGNALTLVKNENAAFPVQLKPGEKTLLLFADSCASRAGTGDLVRAILQEKQALPDGAELLVMKNTRENEAACVEAALNADHVILVNRVYSVACLDPATADGFSTGAFDKVIDAVHDEGKAEGKAVIVVSCQLPYDAARFPEADAILLTYWSSPMSGLPAEGSTWSSNLPEGLLACFGLVEAPGRLPVSIPALDGQYKPTDRVLYAR